MNILILMLFYLSTTVSKPNIIIILSDDQDLILGGLTPLQSSLNLLQNGVVFENAFATTPVCCPSRSSILTGNYLHTHQTLNNSFAGNCSSSSWQDRWEPETFNVYLQQNNYRTFYGGKYLNQYGRKKAGGVQHVPKGWDWWIGLVGNSVYYNYTLSINGSARYYGDEPKDYLTDVLKFWAIEFLRTTSEKPFLMVISPPAAHEPFTPANKYKGFYRNMTAPRTPNFNEWSGKTKHWLLRLPPEKLADDVIKRIDETFQHRWETLLSVDELISNIYRLIPRNNTYIFITSDHGFHLGQFGQVWDKRQPYETDIRIPLIVSGPGLRRKTVQDPVLTVDLAPTILDIGEIPKKPKMDGKSFYFLLRENRQFFDRLFPVEYHGEYSESNNNLPCFKDSNVKLCAPDLACKCFDAKNNTFTCWRKLSNNINSINCTFQDDEGFVEIYDLTVDPYQLKNLAMDKF